MTLADYICGKCGEEFSTNERDDSVRCPECDAVLCEHCHRWTGRPTW